MKFSFVAASAVFLSACSALPDIEAGPSPANAAVAVPAKQFSPVFAGTINYQPVAPKPWLENNERAAPKGKEK